MSTIRLTMGQALVRYLCNQYTIIDGRQEPLFAGLFGIFGHGNVTCISEALEGVQDKLPTWRGQNEQSMALAAVAYAKAMRRRQIMVALSSIGPGALNMVTAAGCAHANRLPVLILAGDIFANRRPDPVLQQVEHFSNPTTSVNDAFKAVSRYWDRIMHPEQIISSLPQAIATMLDPGDCGPAFIGLAQDTQEIAFDYPEAFFTPTVHTIPRPRPDRDRVAKAVELIKGAKRPLIISGGGVRYSGAEKDVADFALKHGVPMAETIAGKGAVTHDHPAHVGPIGVIGSSSANEMAGAADVIIAIGTRLQDFTTGSWTVFSHDAQFVSINAARYDATKHRALAVVGDAKETVVELEAALGGWKADAAWTSKGKTAFKAWNDLVDAHQKPTNAEVPTYAHVVGMVNKWAAPNDTMVTAAGGLPGETAKGWRIKNPHTFDLEFGFSAMGYEVAGGWGHAMAKKGDGETIVMVGDGSYMMMTSDIYSTVLTGHKMIVIVCDNGGYAVIRRLQVNQGGRPFNNQLEDCQPARLTYVDFAMHAAAMGATTETVQQITDLPAALQRARQHDSTYVIVMKTSPNAWTEGGSFWEVGVPETSHRPEVVAAGEVIREAKKQQRVGW